MLFVECLKSLQNLHTLEIGWTGGSITTILKNALKGVKLPQIKTLIIPPAAHPLLRHCCDVEDVICVVKEEPRSPDGILRSLASKRGSKVKRLAIPLVAWPNPSRKRLSILEWRVRTMTDCSRPQGLWLHVQSSLNLPSSPLTRVASSSTRRRSRLTRRAKVYTRRDQNLSLRARHSRISTHSRLYVFPPSHLI